MNTINYRDNPKNQPYDAVIVLCGGLRKVDAGYQPTTFEDGDEFGMLGGFIRVVAAAELYWQGRASRFLFSTGVSAKQIAKFGPDVPPEAGVYRDLFVETIHANARRQNLTLPLPEMFLEDKSVNTVANLQESVAICKREGWQCVAIISSEYHVPRIAALYDLIATHAPLLAAHPIFLAAEPIVTQAQPGAYDAQIDAAYRSEIGQKRIANEHAGLAHIQSGQYTLHEYQLK